MASKASPKVAAPLSRAVVRRTSSANNYIALVVIITFLVVIVCGFFAKVLIGSIILDSKLILYTNQANNDLTKKLQDIPQLISNYDGLGTNQSLIAAALPTGPDFPALVSISEAMSNDSGAALKSVTPDSSSTDASSSTTGSASGAAASSSTGTSATPTPYKFDVVIDGTYSQVVKYFQDVERSARPMSVVSTQLTGDGSALQVATVIQTYYQAPANTNDQTETIK